MLVSEFKSLMVFEAKNSMMTYFSLNSSVTRVKVLPFGMISTPSIVEVVFENSFLVKRRILDTWWEYFVPSGDQQNLKYVLEYYDKLNFSNSVSHWVTKKESYYKN